MQFKLLITTRFSEILIQISPQSVAFGVSPSPTTKWSGCCRNSHWPSFAAISFNSSWRRKYRSFVCAPNCEAHEEGNKRLAHMVLAQGQLCTNPICQFVENTFSIWELKRILQLWDALGIPGIYCNVGEMNLAVFSLSHMALFCVVAVEAMNSLFSSFLLYLC